MSRGNSTGVGRGGSLALKGWGLPGATGLFEALGNGQDQLVLIRPADDLDADGETFVRKTDWDGGAREAGEIQPLRIAHGVQISRAGAVVSAAMEERGTGGNWGEKDG